MSGFEVGDKVCVSGESQDIGRTGIVLGNWSIVDLGGSEGQKWFPTNWLVPVNSQIDLPLEIIPHGWWVAKNRNGSVTIFDNKPQLDDSDWRNVVWTYEGKCYSVAPPIAAQLPQEWHSLPWNKSLIQQTKGC